MSLKTEIMIRPAILLVFCSAQLGVINGLSGYIFITQPPSDLLCNPHSSNSATGLRLECSIGVLDSTELPVDTSILWYRKVPQSAEPEQLCGSSVTKFMAASLFADKSVGLRSIIEVRASSSRDLVGEYWCQVAKVVADGSTLLSNQSTVLEIRTKDYYRNKELSRCEDDIIFLELITSLQSVEFSSSTSPLTADNAPTCSMDPAQSVPESERNTVDPNSVSGDDSFTLPRMWVYILVPVIATLLILLFLFLLIALVATCFQKRDSKRRLPSSIANIELVAASNSDSQIKSSILAAKSTPASNSNALHSTAQTPVPTPRPSISTGSVLHVDQILGKNLQQLQQPHNLQSGDTDEDDKNETDEEDYTEVPSKQDRKAAKVIGMLKGACNATRHGSPSQSSTTEVGSVDGTAHAGNFEYRSLDPDAMEPPHTYHAMRSSSASNNTTSAARDGPQPMYSEPGGIHGHQKAIPAKKQRPPPPLKIPPRRIGGNHSKPIPVPPHKPVQSVPSVDGEYVDPNECNSPNSSPNLQNMYQGLTPNKLEYLALYATPVADSTPH